MVTCYVYPHSMAIANLNKSEELMTNTTAASKYIPKRPRICINWNPPFRTKIYLIKVPLNVNIVKQDFMKWGLKGGISIDADSGLPRYVLWCCGGICQEDFTFIQIGSGHCEPNYVVCKYTRCKRPYKKVIHLYKLDWCDLRE